MARSIKLAFFLVATLALASPASLLFAQLPSGLPPLLETQDGTKITSTKHWEDVRRPELLELFKREMYGQMPQRPADFRIELVESGPAYDGRATRKQFQLHTGTDGPVVDLLVYLPAQAKTPAPIILSMNFWGNHSVSYDKKILLARSFVEARSDSFVDNSGVKNNRATESCRGANAKQWPIEKILDRGYAFATMYRNDVDLDDKNGLQQGVRRLFPKLQNRADNFSTIGAWAWGFSRAIDCLVEQNQIDSKRIAIFGWSRLGKAALWAAANDGRVALTISNEAGAGGGKLFRRNVGESIERLNRVFPHWFCENFNKYNGRDEALPFDQHMVISLIAPRAVCIGAAEQDQHADPEGEFWGLKAAEPVFVGLYGLKGIPAKAMLSTGEASFGQLGFQYRAGKHDVLESDWNHYLNFCDLHLKAK